MLLNFRHLKFVFFIFIAILQLGCIHEDIVTTRPEYAFPQNLQSLCIEGFDITVDNSGEFITTNIANGSSKILLSTQLFPLPASTQRHISRIRLKIESNQNLIVTAINNNGRSIIYKIPEDQYSCNELGELAINFPSENFYFWASFGNKTRELIIWTNKGTDLIVQNRWKETQTGIIGGAVTGDAWAIFKHATLEQPNYIPDRNLYSLDETLDFQNSHKECPSLSGSYSTTGEEIRNDGSMAKRPAHKHFFREEIIGEQPINQQEIITNRLEVVHRENNDITLNIYDEKKLIASRLLNAKDISCSSTGKWEYKGEIKAHSPWLIIAASAGVYWENLTFWLDDNGDLLVDSLYKSKSILLLVPFARMESTFVAFPKKPDLLEQ